MKKTIAILLIMVLSIGLFAGCSPEQNDDAEPNDNENNGDKTESSEITISTGKDTPDYTETLETDVLVLGGGGAGLTSALTASENGSKVILAEKLGYLGGATMMSGGIVPAAGTAQQKEAGIEDDQDLFARDIFRPNAYSVRKDLVYTITENAKDAVEWLEEQGVVMTLITKSLYYGQSNYRMHIADGSGQGMTQVLIDNVNKDENIEVMLNSPAIELAVEDGEVIGAFIKKENEDTILVKSKNTILATSGFASNEDMMNKYIPEMKNAYPLGAPGATGEGIIWGQNLGANVANMKAYQGHGVYSEELGKSLDLYILYRGGILVNKKGQRFTNEHKGYSELSPEILAQPESHVYMIFNQENANNTSRFDEFNEAGIVTKGDSLEDLASKLEIDVDNFKNSVKDYVNGIKTGQDSLNRTLFPKHFNGPYYAMEITADLRHTQGGLVTDIVGHVLNKDGELIKGLYAAGGVMEGFSDTAGPGYMSGNGLLQAFVFGRLAGEQAATTTRDDASVKTMEFEEDALGESEEIKETPDENITYKDGTYEGVGQGHHGDIKANVTVSEGKISAVEIVEQSETEAIYETAEQPVINSIIKENSYNVDAVTGATKSSNGIMEAVKNALEEAK